MEAGEASAPDFVLLGDQPHEATNDPLGFDGIVADLAPLILASRRSTPFTLGIEAAWGMGKSTLMARLCARLSEEPGIKPVLFNAWTADDGGVLEGLVKTVLNELDPNVLRRALRSRKLISGLRVAFSAALGLLGLGNVADTVWNRVASDPRARNDLRQLIDQAVTDWRDKQPEVASNRLLCVFVDDLDRCSPEGVLEVFEAMKLYLDVPGIVFVVGYDQDIVSDLVLKEKGYSEAIQSRDYLEKFIQIVYRIPRPARRRSSALVESLLEASGTAGLFGPTERQLVVDGSQSNPRRIKRFINAFVLAYGLQPHWREFAPQDLVRVQLLQMYFPDFARMLERPSATDPIKEYFEYREARSALRRRKPDSSEVASALTSHGLAVMKPERDEDFDLLLARIEENIPVAFTSLASREDFATLVKSLGGSADWDRLRTALAKGTLPFVSAEPVETAKDSPNETPDLDGLRILWVDDEPDRNEELVDSFRDAGANVTAVPDSAQMKDALKGGKFDVLLSDIARDGNREEGLDVAEVLYRRDRERGPWRRELPPVIFFTSRVTRSRLKRVDAVGGRLTAEEDRLWAWLGGLAARRHRQSSADPS
ncbi:MAG TPA: P-loop NTPase fold protein [Solirubrobacterales bacterium]|nr:P-loop NTPase fold protein [Solirubrobacterales bacterium]